MDGKGKGKSSSSSGRRSLRDDDLLLEPVEGAPFTKLEMFTTTVMTSLTNLRKTKASDMIQEIEPDGNIRAVNCNFGHKSAAGWEKYIKTPKERKSKGRKVDVKKRKKQGDGASFNSAIEPVITITQNGFEGSDEELPDDETKVYYVKCFPTTGTTQVPGVLRENLSDGLEAIQIWAQYLMDNGFALDPREPIRLSNIRAFMINFKFRLIKSTERLIVNRRVVADLLKDTDLFEPYRVDEIKCALEAPHISFACIDETEEDKLIRVKIFMKGRVNILGARTRVQGETIYAGLSELFVRNWDVVVELEPLPD